MSADADSLAAKSDEALCFLASHPALYHPDVVWAAQRELRQRGLRIPEPVDAAPVEPEPTPTRSRRPWALLGGGVVAAALLLGVWGMWPAPVATPTASTVLPMPLPAGIVELPLTTADILPSFDSLAQVRVQQAATTVPAAEWRDSVARNNYKQVVARYWQAEYQTAWLLTRATQRTTPDATLLGKIDLIREQWRRLTHVAEYDLKLQPVMQARLQAMLQGHKLRQETMGLLHYAFNEHDSLITREIQQSDTAAYAVRYAVLGTGLPKNLPLLPLRAMPDVIRSQTVPDRYPNTNPLYLLHNQPVASDPLSDVLPPAVAELPSAEIDSVLVLRPQLAVRAYGPLANSGAVLIFTHPPAPHP